MAEAYLGQMMMFGGNFAIRGWAFCDGQLLPISQYSALFSILGTTYGGDGRTTFALPDMRGRVPIHEGTGPGLPTYSLGQKGGRDEVTLTVANLPSHNHSPVLQAANAGADKAAPNDASLAQGEIYRAADPDVSMNPKSIKSNNVGGSQSFDIRQPFLTVNFLIALVGIFPSRN